MLVKYKIFANCKLLTQLLFTVHFKHFPISSWLEMKMVDSQNRNIKFLVLFESSCLAGASPANHCLSGVRHKNHAIILPGSQHYLPHCKYRMEIRNSQDCSSGLQIISRTFFLHYELHYIMFYVFYSLAYYYEREREFMLFNHCPNN